MAVALWSRWAAMHGVPRTFMKVRARQGDPMARLIASHGRESDPYPTMEEIRSQGALVRTPFVWATVDHDVCRSILRDNDFGVTPPSELELPWPLRSVLARTDPGVANPVEPPAMVITNPPDHTRYRRLIAKGFTPRATDTLVDRVREVTSGLVDRLADTPNPDLIADFAARLPVAIIAEILGLPADSHDRLLQWGRAGAPLLDVGIGWRTYRDSIDGLRGLDEYLREHLRRMRSGDSSDDPFSTMVADRTLTDRELTANAALLIGAGFETTVNLIGNGIVLLLNHPEQLALLHDDPDLWPGAIEEILRFDSPVQMTARTALRDGDVAGHSVAKGDTVALLLGGANRDPLVFSEPGRFDVIRENAREHLAFSSGIHACVGAALARIEGATALRALFEAFPGLRLSEPPQRRGLVTLRGYTRLSARVGSGRAAARAIG